VQSIRLSSSFAGLLALALAAPSPARAQNVPDWLAPHVGAADGQIAPPVLRRARALYLRKTQEGAIKNPCYFAMDATRPNDLGGGRLGKRFYLICEREQLFRAYASGHGGGRDLGGSVDFSNGRVCAKNFGNAEDSKLTTGGAYVTAETKVSFKGYYRTAEGEAAYSRAFIQFDGEGDAADARARAIGGHAARLLRNVCLEKKPDSPHADSEGYVPRGTLVDYGGGRSNGCTSWTAQDAAEIVPVMRDDPTTLYIYPESRDIQAVARAAVSGRLPAASGLYWDAKCLKAIKAPKFWREETLAPILARYAKDHPPPPPRPTPLCR
jgi:hypothetical protein